MQTMDQCLQNLVEKKLITLETAREKARQPESIG
jgi:twitching motility protein PilT